MDCLAPEEIDAFLAGRMPPDRLARAEAHVDTCATCRMVINRMGAETESGNTAQDKTVTEHGPRKPAEPAKLPKQIGRYEVERTVGAGGMGVVLLAEDADLKRKVVIKLLRPGTIESGGAARERLLREAQAMAKVSHVNVASIFDVGIHDGQVFLAMEYLEGGDLAQWLLEKREIDDVLRVFVQAGRGLAAAHDAGLVHRDFKPHNVLLGKAGEVKVTDFGLARTGLSISPVDEADRPSRPKVKAIGNDLSVDTLLASPITQHGAMVGTPAYMAPEQIEGKSVDARSDQFSFCVALFEALYGQRPFRGESTEMQLEATLAGVIPEVPTDRKVPARVREAVKRGLSVDPAKRFSSMRALLTEIVPSRRMAWMTGGSGEAPRRRPWLLFVGGGITIAAGVTAFALARGKSTEQCTGLDRALAGIWDAEVAGQMKAKLGDSFPAVKTALDHYTSSWTAVRVDACKATRVRGDQSDDALAKRVTCLDARLRDLRAFTKRLLDDPATFGPLAAEATSKLVSPTTCANAAAVAFPFPSPDDPRVQELEKDLADLNIDFVLGKSDRIRERIAQATIRADAIPYPPVQADAHMLAASVARYQGDLAGAEDELRKAIRIAEMGQYDLGRTRATNQLGTLLLSRGDLPGARNAADLADATLARIGGDPSTAIDQLQLRAEIAKTEAKLDEAQPLFEKVVSESRTLYGDVSPQLAAALFSLAGVYFDRGRADDAKKLVTESQAILGKLYPNRPAIQVFQLIQESSQELMSGNPRRSLDISERALLLMESAPDGFPDRLVAEEYFSIATGHMMLDEWGPARDGYERAATMFERQKISTEAAYNFEMTGRADIELGRFDDALKQFRHSVEIATESDPNGKQRVMSRQGIGKVLAEHGGPVDEAIAELEWVMPKIEAIQPTIYNTLANTKLALAEALWRRARPGDRDRAKALATQAKEDMQHHREPYADGKGIHALYLRSADKLTARVDAWIAAHK